MGIKEGLKAVWITNNQLWDQSHLCRDFFMNIWKDRIWSTAGHLGTQMCREWYALGGTEALWPPLTSLLWSPPPGGSVTIFTYPVWWAGRCCEEVLWVLWAVLANWGDYANSQDRTGQNTRSLGSSWHLKWRAVLWGRVLRWWELPLASGTEWWG